ncbi:G-patch domain [Dillenia turbinata]|uniref:G-patch domain n=1 Tax=Dillenia turbinata TaxID=194707 RepID=A0AAN8YWR7_9MAGN
MDGQWYNDRQDASTLDQQQKQREERYQDSLIEDWGDDFRLPISHRPTENVNLDDVEQASLDTQLTSSNIGFRLLQKMGWKGKGLGKDEQGIIEPIKSGIRDPKLGVGKQEEDDYFTAEENIQRRKLNVEVEETEEHAKKREVIAEREQKIQTEVKEIRKVFYCDLCNKQYKLAMEFEAHLSSYDHNHRKRFKEMREMHGTSSRDDRERREQQRLEKEIAKFAQIFELLIETFFPLFNFSHAILALFNVNSADARKQQQQQEQEHSSVPPASSGQRSATALADQDQRKTLKFGFSSKGGSSKIDEGVLILLVLSYAKTFGNAAKKQKATVQISSVFGNDSDEE